MKEQIEEKIGEIIGFIIMKPASKITLNDYTILSSELRDIRFREAEAERQEQMEHMLAVAAPAFAGNGKIRQIHPVDCA